MVDGAMGDVHIRCGGNADVTRGGHNRHGASKHTGKACRDEMAFRVDFDNCEIEKVSIIDTVRIIGNSENIVTFASSRSGTSGCATIRGWIEDTLGWITDEDIV